MSSARSVLPWGIAYSLRVLINLNNSASFGCSASVAAQAAINDSQNSLFSGKGRRKKRTSTHRQSLLLYPVTLQDSTWAPNSKHKWRECLVYTIKMNSKTSHLTGRYLLISCLIKLPLDMHNQVTYFLLMVRQPLVGQGLLTVEAWRSHSIHITLGKTPLHEWSAHSQRPRPDNTQHL